MIFARNMAAACVFAFAFVWACASAKAAPSREGQIRQAIYHVFGRYGAEAVRVARCESGLSIWARNGQYAGIFQMGSSERARYARGEGHWGGWWAQIRSAHNYFVASGHTWRAWSCKP